MQRYEITAEVHHGLSGLWIRVGLADSGNDHEIIADSPTAEVFVGFRFGRWDVNVSPPGHAGAQSLAQARQTIAIYEKAANLAAWFMKQIIKYDLRHYTSDVTSYSERQMLINLLSTSNVQNHLDLNVKVR